MGSLCRGVRVLLVEDNPDNRAVYETILRYFNFAVETASNGREGIRKAIHSCPDIILMDIQMPVLDGLSAARELKASDQTRLIPIIMLTAFVREEDRAEAMRIGCEGFLTKPCPPKDVAAEVTRIFESTAERRAVLS